GTGVVDGMQVVAFEIGCAGVGGQEGAGPGAGGIDDGAGADRGASAAVGPLGGDQEGPRGFVGARRDVGTGSANGHRVLLDAQHPHGSFDRGGVLVLEVGEIVGD